MKTILVAADFSESAIHAAQYAAQLSAQLKADYLILYHAHQLLPDIDDDSPASVSTSKAQTREHNGEFLPQLRQQLSGLVAPETLVLTRAETIELGKGINDIAAVCDKRGLLVIGSSSYLTKKPRIAWKENGTGKLMQAASLPLLIVPKTAEFQPIKKILLACDFEDVCNTLPFTRLRLLIETLHAQLSVVHVNNRLFQKEEHKRESITFNDLFEDLDPSTAYIQGRDVSKAILKHAADQGAQLIVVVAKDRTLVDQLLHKSVSKELALESSIPLLVIRR